MGKHPAFINGPTEKRTDELFQQHRNQLRIITGLLTGY